MEPEQDLYQQPQPQEAVEGKTATSIVNQILAKQKGRTAKKSASSSANLAKARAAKLAQLKAGKQKKNTQMSVVYEDQSEEEESEDEPEFVLKPLTKVPLRRQRAISAPIAIPQSDNSAHSQLAELSSMVAQLVMAQQKKPRKSKPKTSRPSVIVNMPTPQTAPPNPLLEKEKQDIFKW